MQYLFILRPLALPARFKKELKNEEATESGTATLQCELTKAVDSVEWTKDDKVLKPSGKYRMRQEGRFAELIIQDLDLKDAGNYTCVCGGQKTTAALTVNGKLYNLHLFHIHLLYETPDVGCSLLIMTHCFSLEGKFPLMPEKLCILSCTMTPSHLDIQYFFLLYWFDMVQLGAQLCPPTAILFKCISLHITAVFLHPCSSVHVPNFISCGPITHKIVLLTVIWF